MSLEAQSFAPGIWERTQGKIKFLWNFYNENKNASIDEGEAACKKAKKSRLGSADTSVVREMARFGIQPEKFQSAYHLKKKGITLKEFIEKNGGDMGNWPWPKLSGNMFTGKKNTAVNGAQAKAQMPAGIRPIHRKHPKKKPQVKLSEVREKAKDAKMQELSTGDYRVSRLITVPVRQIQAVLADQRVDHIEIYADRMVIWPLPPGPITVSMD